MTTTYYYVSAFDNVYTGWSRVGSSPYLSTVNSPIDYIFVVELSAGYIGVFDFTDSGAENSEVIDSVDIQIYRKDKLNDPVDIGCSIWDGSTWTYVGDFAVSNNVWAWKSIDVSAILNTWAKIDSARLYLAGGAADTAVGYVDCARIRVVSHAVAVGVACKRLLVGVGL